MIITISFEFEWVWLLYALIIFYFGLGFYCLNLSRKLQWQDLANTKDVRLWFKPFFYFYQLKIRHDHPNWRNYK